MLGVCLRKFCPQDSVGYTFREKKTCTKIDPQRVQNRPASKMASGRPPDGSFVPSGPNLAKAAGKPCLGGSLGRSSPVASRAAPGRLLGVVLGLPRG